MSSAMISQTVQGAVLSATSNILAQVISSYKDNTPFTLNPTPIIKFVIFSIISNPPNIIWQTFLEDQFPNAVPASIPSSEKNKANGTAAAPTTRTSKTNILIKFILDQTVGAVVNTLMFLAYIGYVNTADTFGGNGSGSGKDAWAVIQRDCWEKTWPMMLDGYKFWPMVSLVNFLWVPVDKRVVVGCAAGVVWGIYLSLLVEG